MTPQHREHLLGRLRARSEGDAEQELAAILAELLAGRFKKKSDGQARRQIGYVRTAAATHRVLVSDDMVLITIMPRTSRGGNEHTFKLGRVLGR